MDLAYNPHAERARRKNRSNTNLHHLSLAPLTTKIPIHDVDASAFHDASSLAPQRSTSYLQGKSAPTTPRLLSHSPAGPRSRSRHRRTPSAPGAHVPNVSKSKSTTHLLGAHGHKNGPMASRHRGKDDLELRDRSDSDWLLRTGALMSTEAREYKGQSWLVSRQSSTSLAAMRDEDDEVLEEELVAERERASRLASRRGSSAALDEDAGSRMGSRYVSRHASRAQSRSHSLAGLRSAAMTPGDRDGESYFPAEQEGPDFVDLDERLEELEQDTSAADDAAVRRLVQYGTSGGASWISNMIGWRLFSVEENDGDSDEEVESSTDAASQTTGRSGLSSRHLEGMTNYSGENIQPPRKDETAWGDAAWLLGVATKVIF
ncbi:uncharacterized protein J7T54_001500 [Emericellopsis cladophorae]|uniref:Uncharacterized protein n=1 Tax=Emericellopsis cladophorae TaxID=2686198 RepID=A0A9Q0BDM7_9HYPO|nr:uncharacterized protein J7T54_001500 [Emericellopsis cladophorae]KAI6781537.1 hypothetical protein J7T54_001500 [Emericellopsis cladophorae]